MKNQPIQCLGCGVTCTPWRHGRLCQECQWESDRTWEKVRKQRVIEMLFELVTPTCTYCGDGLTFATYSLDHVRTRSQGGSHERSNLTWACRPCNQMKKPGVLA